MKKNDKRKTMWNPIPKNIVIHYPFESPSFSTKDLDRVFEEVFKKNIKERACKQD